MPSSLVVIVPSPSATWESVSSRRGPERGGNTLVEEGEGFLELGNLFFSLPQRVSERSQRVAPRRRTNESAISVEARNANPLSPFVPARALLRLGDCAAMPSTSTLTSTEKQLVKTHAVPSPNDKILSVAIARIYHATPEWQFTGLFGALVFGWSKGAQGWLRLVDLAVLPSSSSPLLSAHSLAASDG